MSKQTQPTNLPHSNSAGSVGSDHRHLDSHYLLAKAEYESCIASVGIQPGWRVLDAGCGTGTFLPYIADLVGPTGSVVALDHAAESIDHVRAWVESDRPTAQFETYVGPLHALPFPDASFDCIWNANVVIYITLVFAKRKGPLRENAISGMLAELFRNQKHPRYH